MNNGDLTARSNRTQSRIGRARDVRDAPFLFTRRWMSSDAIGSARSSTVWFASARAAARAEPRRRSASRTGPRVSASRNSMPRSASVAWRAGSPPDISPSAAPISSENRRGDADGGLSGAAEQPEHEPAEQARVETCLWRQVGERRVADPRRQQIRRERDAGHDVAAQPRPVVRRQPARAAMPCHSDRSSRRRLTVPPDETLRRHDVPCARYRAILSTRRRRLTLSCASDRASDAFTVATSSSEILSRRRAAARWRASSAFASSMLSAATAMSVTMDDLSRR